jgi:DNA-nicking Smr family endonuclease
MWSPDHTDERTARMSAPIITVDLHGLKQEEAMVVIDRELAHADSGVYQIKLVHGYHRGTALRDMIRMEYRHHKKVKRITPGDNQGVTVLVLREL